jgi:hypothetical protein
MVSELPIPIPDDMKFRALTSRPVKSLVMGFSPFENLPQYTSFLPRVPYVLPDGLFLIFTPYTFRFDARSVARGVLDGLLT